MSIFSDYEHGYMDDFEFKQECNRMNRQDRYEREFFEEPDFDDLESLDEERSEDEYGND